jgi:hypothetical protein
MNNKRKRKKNSKKDDIHNKRELWSGSTSKHESLQLVYILISFPVDRPCSIFGFFYLYTCRKFLEVVKSLSLDEKSFLK